MKVISKKNQSVFIEEVKSGLLNVGAVPFVSDSLQFDLETKYGVLWIRIDEDQKYCYTVFTRFIDPSTAPMHLNGINSFSGKWNQHLGTEGSPKVKAQIVIDTINQVLN